MNQNITKLQPLRLSDTAVLETKSLTELYETGFVSGEPIIEDLLFPGVYLLAGDSKIGKSFLVSQLAFCVATGTPFWERPVQKSDVLYLALEDQFSRIQRRMYQMFGTTETENLHFAIDAKTLGSGLENQLEAFVSVHQNTRLIIIDTLQKIRCSADTYSYAKDYEVISKLKSFAERFQFVCCLFIIRANKTAVIRSERSTVQPD